MFGSVQFAENQFGGGEAEVIAITSANTPGYLGLCVFGQPLWTQYGLNPISVQEYIEGNYYILPKNALPYNNAFKIEGRYIIVRKRFT